jgi:hypothetical protein
MFDDDDQTIKLNKNKLIISTFYWFTKLTLSMLKFFNFSEIQKFFLQNVELICILLRLRRK